MLEMGARDKYGSQKAKIKDRRNERETKSPTLLLATLGSRPERDNNKKE
jgi:hypothetical protein